jgi:hypothetical protein
VDLADKKVNISTLKAWGRGRDANLGGDDLGSGSRFNHGAIRPRK